jgi:YesN/AraC family two-component response regulator
VEDDEDTRDAIQTFLKRRLGKVIIASNGEEGLRKYYDERPQIIIADILMPKMNGLEMLSKIREADSSSAIIITSTVNESDTILKAIDYGIIKYVVKPIILSELEAVLNKVADELHDSKTYIAQEDVNEKHRLENLLKKELTLFIKNKAGKGPRDLSVFIHHNRIDVTTYNATSSLENTILNNKRDAGLVEQLRRAFYTQLSNELSQLILDVAGINAGLSSIGFSATKQSDQLEFEICRNH